jgi:hypothetical protein
MNFSGAALSAALLLSTLAASPAHAALSVNITEVGGNSVQFNDNAAYAFDSAVGFPWLTQADQNPATGSIYAIIGTTNTPITYDNFETALFTATAGPGTLGLGAIEGQFRSPGTVTIMATSTDQAPGGKMSLTQDFRLNYLYGDATVTIQGYADPANTPFGTSGITTGPLSVNAPTSTPLSALAEGTFTSPFSLTEVATIAFQSAGSWELGFNGDLSAATPEPASMVLFGTVLAVFTIMCRRRLVAQN